MLDKIHISCTYVMENSKHVKINYDVLDEFISSIDCKSIKNWLLYDPYNLLDMEIDKIINFILVFEAIDYSFWGTPKWTIEVNGEKKMVLMLFYT